jgi:hypothetical protein
MSLMAIILWALYPLSPWRRLYGLAHYLLDVLIRNMEDPRTLDWLCAHPDDPRGIPHIELAIDDLHASLDVLIYARERTPRSQARSCLWARIRFNDAREIDVDESYKEVVRMLFEAGQI